MSENPLPIVNTSERRTRPTFFLVTFVLGMLFLTGLLLYLFSPVYLPESVRVTIEPGSSITKAAEKLKEAGIIRSSLSLSFLGRLDGFSLKAGTYLFEDLQTLPELMTRLKKGDYGDVFVRVTIPEGSSNAEIEKILNRQLPEFDAELFRTLTKDKEGYLFPDTYVVLPETETEEIVTMMEQAFSTRIASLLPEIERSQRSLSDIVTMASLIEKEASDSVQEQRIVSGILWKRIKANMPLQVDAPFLYWQGKTSAQLSLKDLRNDHPYNTYTRRGLTPTPIGNPGLSTIMAALAPEDSLYFYYLHDTKGGIHYGKNHDEHVRNKQRYL